MKMTTRRGVHPHTEALWRSPSRIYPHPIGNEPYKGGTERDHMVPWTTTTTRRTACLPCIRVGVWLRCARKPRCRCRFSTCGEHRKKQWRHRSDGQGGSYRLGRALCGCVRRVRTLVVVGEWICYPLIYGMVPGATTSR